MRIKLCALVSLALLLPGAASTACAQELGPRSPATSYWWQRLNPFAKTTAPPTLNTAKQASAAARPTLPPAPTGPTLTQARSDFLRRQAVCDQIRAIAIQKKDVRLEEQANLLEERAWNLFCELTGQRGLADGQREGGPPERSLASRPQIATPRAAAPSTQPQRRDEE